MGTDSLRNPSVVIIGAGMTGILLAIKLREAGITDLTILEKSDRLGGTWRENTYPGVACDIPAHMYTYSFEPNPEWSHRFAHGEEIQQYFERVGRKYGVTNSISFGESVASCIYKRGKWTVTTEKNRTISADFVVNCTGILHHPAKPELKGLDQFGGAVFHTSEWNHDVNLSGKRVGIIGTGSTATQVIPEVAAVADHLSVFQRTPQWILPIGNRTVQPEEKERLRKNPVKLHRLRKRYMWAISQLLTKAVTGHRVQYSFFSSLCKLNLRFSVRDRDLRAKLTPDYKVGCKRIVVNTTFYPAVQRENVDLVTVGIGEIKQAGVQTIDGRLHDLDVLILATGFDPVAYMRPMQLIGSQGLSIDQAWSKKIRTYRSLCIPGFPNNFLMLGPSSPIGNYSVIEMSEVQCGYLLKLIARWQRSEFDAIEVKESAVERFASYIRTGMKNTVWLGGCQSWYLDGDGDPILWPYTWEQWVEEMSEPEISDFSLTFFENSSQSAERDPAEAA
ncbi:MAG: NAD(P)/FAD-dependent oxidoreductase [Pseudomonadota bacterium]